MAQNIKPLTSCISPNRGQAQFGVNWGKCGTQPSMNDVLDILDLNSQVKLAYVIAHSCNADFPVAPDNSDCTAQIELAIAMAKIKYGRVILVNDGIPYKLPVTALITSEHNVIIEGTDNGTIISGDGYELFNITAVDYVTFKNIHFTSGTVAVKSINSTKPRFINCKFEGQMDKPLVVDNNPFITISDCFFLNSAQGSILLENTNQYTITGNSFYNSGTSIHNTYDAITINGCSFGNILYNYEQEQYTNKARRFVTLDPTSLSNSIAFNKILSTVDPIKVLVPVGNDVLSNF